MNLPIVVVCYNRTKCLKRILKSLAKSHYNDQTKLIISIDGDGPPEVLKIAKKFQWEHGNKEIIEHNRHLGLRDHVIYCGGLAEVYDGIILLEDDLYVSPWFYYYALEAALFYGNCNEISGISLYSPSYNETARLPFCPLNDNKDFFFMQLPSSWGQIFLSRQWKDFSSWYSNNAPTTLINDNTLPLNVRLWPQDSWKKYFCQYMITMKKYFVYPRHSYSTNFGDKGEHHKNTNLFQVPLVYGKKEQFKFIPFNKSLIKYDSFCEINSKCLINLAANLRPFEFAVDLYGTKEIYHLNKPYVITSKECSDCSLSFDKALIPLEANIIESIPGDKLFMSRVENIRYSEDFHNYLLLRSKNINELKYHYCISDKHLNIKKTKPKDFLYPFKAVKKLFMMSSKK